MSNMSYCRFQNTQQDFADCLEHIKDSGLSDDEKRARVRLVRAAMEMLQELGLDVQSMEGDDLAFDDLGAYLEKQENPAEEEEGY